MALNIMTASELVATHLNGTLASKLSIEDDPSIWSIAVLIPVSLYICADPNIGLAPVLLTRILVILAMNFVQKEAVNCFPPWFLLGYQMALQVVMIGAYNFRNIKCDKWSDLGWWLLYMTPVWIAQLITSLFAFKAASVSTIQIIRSILPLMAFAMEKTLYGNPSTVSVSLMASMVMVIAGTTLYGYTSASVTAAALMWIFINSVFTVMATVFRAKFMKNKDFTVSMPLCMTSVSTTAIPIICIAAALTGEAQTWGSVLADTSPTAWFWASMSALVAGCFSFLQFRSQKILSGTSDLMFQNCVKVFIIIMGIMAFGDSFTAESVVGSIVALCGCAWYGYCRIGKEIKEEKTEQPDLKEPLIAVEQKTER